MTQRRDALSFAEFAVLLAMMISIVALSTGIMLPALGREEFFSVIDDETQRKTLSAVVHEAEEDLLAELCLKARIGRLSARSLWP